MVGLHPLAVLTRIPTVALPMRILYRTLPKEGRRPMLYTTLDRSKQSSGSSSHLSFNFLLPVHRFVVLHIYIS